MSLCGMWIDLNQCVVASEVEQVENERVLVCSGVEVTVSLHVCVLRFYGAADANRARVRGRANDAN
eukprot:6103440-Prymnesium_polylepis.1